MRLRPVRLAIVLALLLSSPALAWNNGQPGNANADTAAECSNPPYATHDWVAEQALMLLPQAEDVLHTFFLNVVSEEDD